MSAEASAIAGVQELGNLTLIYDHNRISIEDNTDIALGEDVGARYEAYGWHVQHVDWTHDGTTYEEDVPALYDAIRKAHAVTDKPSFIVLHTIIAWPAPDAQNTGKAHGSALGADEVAATKKVLGFDPEQTFEVPTGVLEHTRQAVERGHGRPGRVGRRRTPRGRASRRPTPRSSSGCRPGACPEGWDSKVPTFPADEKGMATRVASGAVINAARRDPARALGRLCRPGRLQQHDHRGRTVVPARQPRHEDVEGRPAGRARAPLRHPRARHGRDHERHRRPRRHPRLRRHLPHLLRLHARGGTAGGADGTAGHLRLDPRLDRARRGRPDPPADRAPGRAARDPRARRRTPGRRQRDRRLLADRAREQAGRRTDPVATEPAGVPARRGRLLRHQQRPPRRLRAARLSQRPARRSARRRAGRHRLRGPAGRQGSRPARRRRRSGLAWSRCRAGSGSTPRRRRTRRR